MENVGRRALLLLDGEVVMGARQHRIFNASFIIAPGIAGEVPVSCVEKGRWGYGRSAHPLQSEVQAGDRVFSSPEFTFSGYRRSRKVWRVARSVEVTGTYDADQREVWRDVDQYLACTSVQSRTDAFAEGFASRQQAVDEQLAAVPAVAGQVGVAVLHGANVVALDVLGSAELYRKCHRKLLRGALAEPLPGVPSARNPRRIVATACGLAVLLDLHRSRAPGGGETLHGAREGCAVGAASLDGVPYHVTIALC